VKDAILGNMMKEKMGSLHKGLTIKIEVEPGDKAKEDADLKTSGLAPSLPEKDKEVKAAPGATDDPDLPNDEEMGMIDGLINDDEQDDYILQAMKNERPKGLGAKIEQMMVAKKIAKKQKGE